MRSGWSLFKSSSFPMFWTQHTLDSALVEVILQLTKEGMRSSKQFYTERKNCIDFGKLKRQEASVVGWCFRRPHTHFWAVHSKQGLPVNPQWVVEGSVNE